MPKLHPSVTSTKSCCISNDFSILLSQWLRPDRGVHPEGEKMIQYSLAYLNAVSPKGENSQSSCALSVDVSVTYPVGTDLQSRTLLKTFWQAAICQSRDKAELSIRTVILDFVFLSRALHEVFEQNKSNILLRYTFFFSHKSEIFCFLMWSFLGFFGKIIERMTLLLVHYFKDVCLDCAGFHDSVVM